MNLLITAFRDSFQAIFTTGLFSQVVEEAEEKAFFQRTAKNLGIVLLFFTLLLMLAHVVWQQSSMSELAKTANIPGSYPPALYTPWAKLYLPLVWSLYIVMAGAFRYATLIVLGESQRSLYKAMAISAYSTIPLMLSGLLLNLYNNLSPFYQDKDLAKLQTQLSIFLFLFFLFFFWEARVNMILGKKVFYQNTGRAFLTWLFPVLNNC